MSDDDLDVQAEISWLTVRTTDINAVVEILELEAIRQGRWQDASEKINGKRQTTANKHSGKIDYILISYLTQHLFNISH